MVRVVVHREESGGQVGRRLCLSRIERMRGVRERRKAPRGVVARGTGDDDDDACDGRRFAFFCSRLHHPTSTPHTPTFFDSSST